MTTRHISLLLAILLLLACSFGAAGCLDQEGHAQEQQPEAGEQGPAKTQQAPPSPTERSIKVEVREVKPEMIRDVLILPGETEALNDVLLSAERAGRVEWVGFQEGQPVKQGATLIKIDLDALQAALDRAQASYDLKHTLAERRKSLFKSKVLSQEELDEALTERLRAESSLTEAKVNYNQGVILAPFAGVINQLHVDPGEYVKAGDPMVDMVSIDTIRINVNVPEMDVRFLKKGDRALITVDAYPGEKWMGVIDFVAFKADSATKTFKVRVVVDNKDERIRPGMIARVVFQRRKLENALTAPLFAIIDKGGERVVFVVENGRAKARVIELGVIEVERVQITKGLKVGDQLIVRGQTEVEDGMKVVTE